MGQQQQLRLRQQTQVAATFTIWQYYAEFRVMPSEADRPMSECVLPVAASA
jgi:hypothetical protein